MPRPSVLQQTDQDWLYTQAAEARSIAPFMHEAWMRHELLEIANRFERLAAHSGRPEHVHSERA
jgi:hypothetical protein